MAQKTSAPTLSTQGHVPTATALGITSVDTNGDGLIDAGDVLTANYTFADPDGDDEDSAKTVSTIQWSRDGTAISGATGKTYTLSTADEGHTVSFQVVPWTDATVTDPVSGRTYDSSVVADASGGPGTGNVVVTNGGAVQTVVISGQVSGHPIVATTLTADVTCSGSAGCGPLSYAWERSKDHTTWSSVGVDSATYTPTKDDQLYTIRVTVNRKAP